MLKVHGGTKSRIIIFVHGFNSNPSTFVGDNGSSFFDLLKTTSAIEQEFDWGYYSYESKLFAPNILSRVIRLITPSSTPLRKSNSIIDISEHLKSELMNMCEQYDEWYFICHSMGGLIAKSLIVNLPLQYRSKVKNYITLCTPHLGVPSIILNKLANILGNKQYSDLGANEQTIRDLNHNWHDIKNSVNHTFFYGLYDEIVPKKYSISKDDEENGIPLEDDHFSVTRPTKEGDEVVRKITQILVKSLSSISWSKLTNDSLLNVSKKYAEKEGLNSKFITIYIKENSVSWTELKNNLDENNALRILFVSRDIFSEVDHIRILSKANELSIKVTLWDRRDLSALSEKYPEIGIKLGLVLRTQILLPKNKPTRVTTSLPEGDLINRTKERNSIETFLESSSSIVFLYGMTGVGKSVLASSCLYTKRHYFIGSGVLKLSSQIDLAEILKFFNEIFVSAGFLGFQSIYGNPKMDDIVRIECIVNILVDNKFLVLLDNFEDLQMQEGGCSIPLMEEFLSALAERDSLSKILITTRTQPQNNISLLKGVKLLRIDPFNVDQCETEYIPSLPSLSNAITSNSSWNYEKIHTMTAGIPLILNLLNSYVDSHSLDLAYKQSIEKFRTFLVQSIVNFELPVISETLQLASLLDDGISFDFFEFLKLSQNHISVLSRSPVLQFNPQESCYIMHPAISEAIQSEMEPSLLISLHIKAFQYLEYRFASYHRDDKIRHFSERRRVRHLISAGNVNDAAELLGRIGTRYLSFNSSDDLRLLLQRLRNSILSKKALAWLINVEAHMGDFKRAFEATNQLYFDMLKTAEESGDNELIALSLSNCGSVLRRKGMFKKALKYYWSSYRHAVKNDYKKIQGSVLNNIGQTYTYLLDVDTIYALYAKKVFDRAISIRSFQQDYFRLSATLYNYGEFHIKAYMNDKKNKERLDKGYFLLDKSLQLQLDQENFWLLDRTYESLASFWLLKGNNEKYKEYKNLSKTQKINKEIYVNPRYF